MTHKPEKSDSVVVAVKPTNKAERSAAEPVEPRTGTKGNVGQQSTRRAQDRESVSQALERVRQAARQRKKERFTALLHHVDLAMLRTAFYAIKRDAAQQATPSGHRTVPLTTDFTAGGAPKAWPTHKGGEPRA